MVPSMVTMALGGGKRLLGVLDDVDAQVVEADVDLVQLFRQAGDFLGKQLVDLVVKQKALFFADCDELFYFRVFFFDTQIADPLVKIGFLFEIRGPQACRHSFFRSSEPSSAEDTRVIRRGR